MKIIMKKVLAILLTALMLTSMFGTVAMADEVDPGYHPVDAYVINFSGWEDGFGGYEAVEPLLFQSPHMGIIKYTESGYGWACAEVMNLINTAKLTSTPEANRKGPYASLPAYCADAYVKAAGHEGMDYIRLNLEDASYFANGAAGKVRAIYKNSFPYITDINVVQNAINEWLKSQNSDAVLLNDLTPSEAASATQMAIWSTVHEGSVTVYDMYKTTSVDTLENWSSFICYPSGEYYGASVLETPKSTTEYNMQMVYDYLRALKPEKPTSVVLSEAAFLNKEMMVSINEKGTYTISVKTLVDVNMKDGDSMVLSAKLNDNIQNVQMNNGKHEYLFKFEDVAELADVKLEINGTQTAEDVFFFAPRGGRDQSQSMVAADNSTLPVHAETTLKQDRIINFTKNTQIADAEGNTSLYPLEGIEFELYYAGSVNEYNEYVETYGDPVVKIKDSETGTVKEVTVSDEYLDAVKVSDNLVTTLTTDITGKATYNLTENGKEDGVYLVVEKAHPAIVAPLKPFLIAVPMTSEDGSGVHYTVNVQPKNEVVAGPEIEKDVISIGNNEATLDANEVHTWIIRADIPVDLADGKYYMISDDLDYRLTFKNNLRVTVSDKEAAANIEAESAVLTAGTDYKLDVIEKVNEVNEPITGFTVSLTEAGMTKVAGLVGDAYASNEVRVYFDAVIDEDAAMGEMIPNKATLDYTNSVNFNFNRKSDEPVVYTCGINLYKYAKGNKEAPLAGAKFKLARVATQEEIDAGLSTSLVLGLLEGKENVVYVDFYDNVNWTAEDNAETTDIDESAKVDVVTTGDDGKAMMYGLEAGEYYLVEIQAPAGYNMLNYPIKVTLDKTSASTDNVLEVVNSDGFQLPATGGMGTMLFTVVGAGIVSGAGVSLALKKKREDEE